MSVGGGLSVTNWPTDLWLACGSEFDIGLPIGAKPHGTPLAGDWRVNHDRIHDKRISLKHLRQGVTQMFRTNRVDSPAGPRY